MGQKTIERLVEGFELERAECACTWCGSAVPLPAGDLVGVCISCGMVVFRFGPDRERAACHSITRSCEDAPTPA